MTEWSENKSIVQLNCEVRKDSDEYLFTVFFHIYERGD